MRRYGITAGFVVIAVSVMFGWGASWDFGDRFACASASYFLADLGWALDGLLLMAGLSIFLGLLLSVVVGGWRSLALALGCVVVLAGAGAVGGAMGADRSGCPGEADDLVVPLLVVGLVLVTGACLISMAVQAVLARRSPDAPGRPR